MYRWRFAAIIVASAGTAILAAPDAASTPAPAVSYALHVSLDPAGHRIEGEGRVHWRNTSALPMDEVRLSLYYNAQRLAHTGAAIDVTSLRLVAANRDALAASTFAAADNRPDDGRTILRVPLSDPVPPGGEASLDMRWVAHVPDEAAVGGVVLLAHWFPQMMAVGDRGAYDVTIEVPAGWKVAATGHEQSAPGGGARGRHRFAHAGAPDFAWAASRDWIEQRTHVEREGLPPVDIRTLARPEHAKQLSRLTDAAFIGVQRGQKLLAAYPYADLTVLDLPWRSAYADGAYPGLVTIATRWLEPKLDTGLESRVADLLARHFWHEAAGLGASGDQAMSDGFAVYTAARLGDLMIARHLDSPSGDGFLVERFFGGFIPYVNRSIRFNHAAEHASEDAKRTARALATLERFLGYPTLEMALEEFATPARVAHPSPDAFFEIASAVSGRDLRWFFDGVYRDGLTYDYGVDRVTPQAPSAGAAHRTAIVVRRFGEGVFSGTSRPPVGGFESGRGIDVEVAFADGVVRRDQWDGRDRWTAFVYESAAPVERVEVDPDRVMRLDTARTNNTWTRASRAPAAAARWTALWLLWLEDALLSYAAFV